MITPRLNLTFTWIHSTRLVCAAASLWGDVASVHFLRFWNSVPVLVVRAGLGHDGAVQVELAAQGGVELLAAPQLLLQAAVLPSQTLDSAAGIPVTGHALLWSSSPQRRGCCCPLSMVLMAWIFRRKTDKFNLNTNCPEIICSSYDFKLISESWKLKLWSLQVKLVNRNVSHKYDQPTNKLNHFSSVITFSQGKCEVKTEPDSSHWIMQLQAEAGWNWKPVLLLTHNPLLCVWLHCSRTDRSGK